MENIDEITYEQLTTLIEKLVENKVKKILSDSGVESSSFGRVVSIDKTCTDADGNIIQVSRASVKLQDGTVVSNLFNATG